MYDSAYHCYRLALQEYRLKNDLSGTIECLNKLATIDNIFTRTNQAILSLRECSDLLSRTNAHKDQLAICHEQLGRSYEDLGDIEESGKHTKRALEIKRELYGEDDARTAYAYMLLARYHSFKIANDSSFYYSHKAYTICKTHPQHTKAIRYSELLLQFAYDSKNAKVVPDNLREVHFRNIRKLYLQALDVIRRLYTMPSAEEAAAYQGLANTYNDQLGFLFRINKAQGEACFDSAKMYYDKSIAIKRRLYGEYHRSVSVSYYTKALIYGIHPDLSKKLEALGVYQEAIRAVVPGYVPSTPFDLPVGLKSTHPYQLSVVLKEYYILLRKLHRITQERDYLVHAHAFASFRLTVWDEIVRRFESRESGSAIWIWGRTPFEDAVMSAYDMFRMTGDSVYLEEVFSFSERGRNNDFAELALRSVSSDGLLNMAKKGYSRYNTCVTRKHFVDNVLDDQTAYIAFVPHKESDMVRDFIMVITKDHYTVREVDPVEVDSLVRLLEGAIHTTQVAGFPFPAFRLYGLLLHPELQLLSKKINRLILSVDGLYSKIPFEALLTENRGGGKSDFRRLPYLLNHYSIHYTLSASHLSRLRAKRGPETARLTVLVPTFYKASRLLFSERSAKNSSEIYKGDFHIGMNATRSNFWKCIEQPGIIQLSTHAEADLKVPGKSFLLFSGSENEDSLFLDQILATKINTPLTVISACETGRGKSVYAEGSKSFARAFAFAGSRSVLSTLWRVDDKATADIIDAFYARLCEGLEKPEALRQAKLDFISSAPNSASANPFYWSGLILSGDSSPLIIEKENTSMEILPYILIGCVVFFISVRVYCTWKKGPRQAD